MQGERDDSFVESLIPYVPPLVIRRLADISHPSSQPAAEVYSAAVLFVDIKGFSELAESLAERGPEGAEELAGFLNVCFGRLIRIITEHGGEVTKFAGDALLAIWPVLPNLSRVGSGARQKLAEMTLQATQCALSIQRRSEDVLRQSESESSLQIGVGAGDIYVVHLGGVLNRWEYLLSGEPLVQMSVAKDLATSGDVVLSPEAWGLIKDHCSGDFIRNRFVRINNVNNEVSIQPVEVANIHSDMVEGMKAYVPAAIVRRLESGFGQWLSEIRHLTILFVKLPGYGTSITHPYATTVPEAQAVMRAMQSSLYRFEGSINKFNVDDKGITLVAAMGLPPLSHKDDAARAIHAALDMQRVLIALDRPCAIGIASGWVFCGPIGNENRREYTVVGNSVNRAARLMQVAEERGAEEGLPSYVLCDEATFEGISSGLPDESYHGSQLRFEQYSGVMLKGRKEPVNAYRPHLRNRDLREEHVSINEKGSLTGRIRECATLRAYLRELTRSESFLKVLLIEGEEGIGKSTILQKCLVDIALKGVPYHVGGGQEFEPSRSYHAWRSIFKEIFEIDVRIDDVGSQRRKVMRKLPILPGEKGFPALALRLTPLLNPVLGLEFAENRLTKSMAPEIREQTTRLFLVRLLQSSFYDSKKQRHQPHVILLDNGQWLDNDSWRLAVTVKNLVRPLLLVIASRPLHQDAMGRPPNPAFVGLLQERNLERLHVEQLSNSDMTVVHSDLVAPCAMSKELSDDLWRKAGGNPYIAKHLIHHWRALGLICADSSGNAELETSVAMGVAPIPGPVHKLIVGRIDRLRPEQQMIVKAASHIDGSFSESDLQGLLRESGMELDLSAHLRSLVILQLLKIVKETPPVTYRFTYELISDVARGLLTREQLQVFQADDLMAS